MSRGRLTLPLGATKCPRAPCWLPLDQGVDLGPGGGIISSLAWERLGTPQSELVDEGKGTFGALCWNYYPETRPRIRGRRWMDGSFSCISGGSALNVTSVSGQDVNLTCKYDIKYHGALSVCWGRGDIPNSGCNNQLIASDGRQVTFGGGASSRYRFLGRLQDGDVSLTVLNVLETDAGRYGCRVEIKGWFNDEVHHIDLSVQRAPKTTTSTPLTTTTEQTHTAEDQMNSTQSLQANSSLSPEVRAIPEDGSSVFLLSVVFGVLALLTLVVAVVVLASRRRRFSKNSELQFLGSAASEMQSRGSVVENVYQLEDSGEGVDGSEYEILPGSSAH